MEYVDDDISARYALCIFTAINMLNYADRYVFSSVKELIKDGLHLSDTEVSLPTTGMLFVFVVFSIILGWISDREYLDRRLILFGSVIFWSIATSLAGLSNTITDLICFRSLIGIGEAAYSTIVPAMIADFYPMEDRNVAYGFFYLAIPVGGAIGYAVGALVGSKYNWRVAFYFCGFPGLLAAFLILHVKNPVVGSKDVPNGRSLEGETMTQNQPSEFVVNPIMPQSLLNTENPSLSDNSQSPLNAQSLQENSQLPPKSFFSRTISDLKVILSNKYYLLAVAGQVAGNFGLGGLADWMSPYLIRFHHSSVGEAGLILGAATIVGGIGGNILGSKVADVLLLRVKSSYFLIPALFTIPASASLLIVLNISQQKAFVYILVLFANVCIWTYIAPIYAVSMDVIRAPLRATSGGLLIFFVHVLGDVISPPLIGYISDTTHSLRTGMQLTWIAIALSGVFWLTGYFILPPLPTSSTAFTSTTTSSSSSFPPQETVTNSTTTEPSSSTRRLTYLNIITGCGWSRCTCRCGPISSVSAPLLLPVSGHTSAKSKTYLDDFDDVDSLP